MVEILKQKQYEPLAVEKQVLVLFAATNGFFDDVPLPSIGHYERELLVFVEGKHHQLLKRHRDPARAQRRPEAAHDRSGRGVPKQVFVGKWRAWRHPEAHRHGAQHAADHQGDEDGRRGEAASRAGAIIAARPYAQKLDTIVTHLVRRLPDDVHPLLRVPESNQRVR